MIELFIGCWLLASLIVYFLLDRYSTPKCSLVVWFSVFVCWLLPLSLTFLLPIDISSSAYEHCLSSDLSPDKCFKPLLYTGSSIRYFCWYIVYWITFIMSWAFVPFLQGYVIAGQFTVLGKIWYSLCLNLIFYGVIAVSLLFLICWLIFFSPIGTLEGIFAFLMATSNALGLLAVVMFLGHGLIRVPRRLWQSANTQTRLLKLEIHAVAAKKELEDSQKALDATIEEIHKLPDFTREKPELQIYVQELLAKAPARKMNSPQNSMASTSPHLETPNASLTVQPIINIFYLENLNYSIGSLVSRYNRAVYEWECLCDDAWHCQDVIDFCKRSGADNFESSSAFSAAKMRISSFWIMHGSRYAHYIAAITCAILSLSIYWSEITLPYQNGGVSIIHHVYRWASRRMVAIELLTLALFIYLAICTYSSFLKLRIFSLIKLVPGNHSDELSLLFFATYITRLIFPLGYNFLTLIEGAAIDRSSKTEFSKVMGTMDLFPLLGTWFNLWVPLSFSIIGIIVLGRFHHRILANFTTNSVYNTEAAAMIGREGDISDGKVLLQETRNQRETQILCNNHTRHSSMITCKSMQNHSDPTDLEISSSDNEHSNSTTFLNVNISK